MTGTYTPQRLDLAVLGVRVSPGPSSWMADRILEWAYLDGFRARCLACVAREAERVHTGVFGVRDLTAQPSEQCPACVSGEGEHV